jgi:hypothetical protein
MGQYSFNGKRRGNNYLGSPLNKQENWLELQVQRRCLILLRKSGFEEGVSGKMQAIICKNFYEPQIAFVYVAV